MTMTATNSTRDAARRQALAVLALLVALAGLILSAAWFGGDLLDRYDAVGALRERLAFIERRPKPSAAEFDDPRAVGSPFLDGPTITVAGAALQQRVDSAVGKAGGAVVSSQVEIDGPQAADGFVNLTENIEIAQPALQQLLYDIEAGMPYLFITVLNVQKAQNAEAPGNTSMIVLLQVAGQWRSTK